MKRKYSCIAEKLVHEEVLIYLDTKERDYIQYCKYLENNSIYCDKCDTLVDNDDIEWKNSSPHCNICGGKLKL